MSKGQDFRGIGALQRLRSKYPKDKYVFARDVSYKDKSQKVAFSKEFDSLNGVGEFLKE